MPGLLTRKILLMVCCCFIGGSVFSQYPKYVVVFKNKNNTPYKVSKPRQYLSVKAINRRTKYNIAIDSTD